MKRSVFLETASEAGIMVACLVCVLRDVIHQYQQSSRMGHVLLLLEFELHKDETLFCMTVRC